MLIISKNVNIYTIAQKANVSTATVSKVINNKEGVSEETRQKIQNLIAENNFKPRISNTISDTVGIFLSLNQENPLSSNYARKMLEGIGDIVFSNNLNMMIIPIGSIPSDPSQFSVFCTKRNICAGVFFNLHDTDSFVNNFSEVLPMVLVGLDNSNDSIPSVTIDNYNSAAEEVNYLIQEGHKDILFIGDYFDMYDHKKRLEGYKKAILENGIEFDQSNIIDISHYSDAELFQILLKNFKADMGSQIKPTAIFACDDRTALRIISAFSKCELSVPNDVSIVGFDDSDFAKHIVPPLTTVRQPIKEMGQTAAKMLMQMIKNKDSNGFNKKIVMDCQLIIRGSVDNVSK